MVKLNKEQSPSEKSELPIKLIVRRKGFKIFTEGTISTISKELDALAEFTDKVTEKLGLVEEVPSAEQESILSPEEVAKIPTADIPVIKPSRRTIENIEALFNTPWGRTPRTVAEVVKALEVNAVPDRVSSVNVYLTRLVQRGVLRRIEKEGKWAYFKLPE
jgi:DNA-binding transcriptional ArsR family regulator